MKQKICFLLALVMLLGLFAGCSQQSGETQPGTEPQSGTEPKATQETTPATQAPTEPEVKDPPRTAEDFIEQLGDVLKTRNIPVELVFDREYDPEYDFLEAVHCSGYAVHTVDENGARTYTGIMLWLVTEIGSDSLTEVLIFDTPQKSRELYPMLCGIASALCDEQMTEEKAAELFATKPARLPYITYTDDIGSYSVSSGEFVSVVFGFGTYKAVFCQPADLTHSLLWIDQTEGQLYKITFTESGENLYADKAFAVTVQELEDGINAWFNAEGIPIECAFQAVERDEIHNVLQWKAFFRFTSLDDPDYQYPTSDLFIVDESQSMAHRQANMDGMVNQNIDIYVNTRGCYPYSPIVSFYIYVEEPYFDGLIPAVCALWDSEMGNSTVTELYSDAIAEEGRTDRNYTITEEYQLYVYPYPLVELTYLDGFYEWEFTEPENLLDPELLEFKYTTSEPMVQDGLFNHQQHYTDIFNMGINSINLQQVSPVSMIMEYLAATGAKVEIELTSVSSFGDWIDPGSYFPDRYNFDLYPFMINESECLDTRYFGFVPMDFLDARTRCRCSFEDQGYLVYYNRCVEAPVDAEYVMRAAVGCGLMLDEGMTVDEAIALHTQPMEPDMVFEGWEVYSYCPREVMHVLMKEPATGQVLYFIISPELFETYYGDLEHFVADDTTLAMYINQLQ